MIASCIQPAKCTAGIVNIPLIPLQGFALLFSVLCAIGLLLLGYLRKMVTR